MIFRHYGRNISLELLKKASQISTSGSSLLGLAEAAEKYGLRTVSAKVTFEQLVEDAPLPCILHWSEYHFVVLTPKASSKTLVIADPAKGLVNYSREEFIKYWISHGSTGAQKGIAMLLTPGDSFYQKDNQIDQRVGWGLLIRYAIQYKRQIVQLFFGLLVGSFLQLIFPYLTQGIVDTGINTQNLNFIQILLAAQFALLFGQTFVEFVRTRILLFISTHINLSLLTDFWIKLMRLPLEFFDTKRTGDIIQRTLDHKRIENFITGTALQTLFALFSLVLFSIVLFGYSTIVFAVYLFGSILYLLWIQIFLKYRRGLDNQRFEIAAKETATTMQMVQGMPEIKLNNAELLKRWDWERLQASLFRLKFRSLSLDQYQQVGAFFINQGKNILITYLVAESVINGELTLGAMLAIQYIVGHLNSPVEQLIFFSRHAQDAKLSLERLNEIYQMENEESKEGQYTGVISETQSITIKNLSFAYPGAGSELVLSNINVEFPAGKVTALMGMSGSGKTTVLKLIQKFYDRYEGEIRIGDTNIRYLRPSYWRSVSGSVMQDGFIFSDSIERNIAVGEEYPEYEKLVSACKTANILDFIDSQPVGFNTKIGAEGIGLSTGQRQRILIARAVYKSPLFILFDEATNSLDANNELSILENLQRFLSGRTAIIVAHRLSTVRKADKIVVLEKGRIIEEGNHESLTLVKGKYYELVRNQLELGT
jgi:ATP-binding cassette subfamily B protein